MALLLTDAAPLSTRSLEALIGTGALAAQPATATSQLSDLGTVTSVLDSVSSATGAAEAAPTDLPVAGAAVEAANGTVLTTHSAIEGTGHDVPVANGPLHGLTHLGETVGLGYVGETKADGNSNLLTDVAGLPQAVAGGDGASSVAPALSDVGDVAGAATGLATSVTNVVQPGAGLVGPGGLASPFVDAVNATVGTLEGAGNSNPVLGTPLGAVTSFGDAIGLGHVGDAGQPNVLTDLLGLPGQAVSGDGIGAVGGLLGGLGQAVGTAGSIPGAVTGIAGQEGGLLGSGGLLSPASELANAAVLDLHASIENTGHEIPVLNEPLHALTHLGETVGLGHLGQTGLLTDVANAPGTALAGDPAGALAPILADSGSALGAVDRVVDSVTHIADAAPGTGLPAGGPLGSGGVLSPASGLANAAVLDLHASIENTGHEIPILNEPLHALTNLGETVGLGHLGQSGLLTDVANAPGTALAGDPAGALAPVLADSGSVLGAVDRVADSVTHIADAAPGAGLPGLGGTLPGIVDGLVSTAGGGGGGAAPLVTVSVGALDATPLGGINLLAPADPGPTHAVDAHVGTAPAGQPPALAIALLGGDALAIPSLGGSGADALVGALAETAPSAAAPALHDAAPAIDLASLTTVAFGVVDGHDATHTGAGHASPLHGLI